MRFHVLQDSESNANDVTLMNLTRRLTGTYKCEVSAGSPSYHTLIERAKMEVVGKYVDRWELKTFCSHSLPGEINLPLSDCPRTIRVPFTFDIRFHKAAIYLVNTYMRINDQI